MRTAIGKVTIEYDQEGNIINSLFEPTMTLTIDPDLTSELKKIECCDNSDTLTHNASLVLSSFFNRMNKIELRDVAHSSLDGTVDHLEKWPDNRIKKAVISYAFDDMNYHM